MKMKYKIFNNSDFEMIKYNNKIIIKDKNENKYYEVDETQFDESKDIEWKNYHSIINDKIFIIYILTFILLFIINVNFYISYKTIGNYNNLVITILFIIYTSINIIIHELSHILSLKIFNRKIDKFGFKFNYIFPSFYVRMNDVHMLSRNEKVLVHSAGLYVNMLFNVIFIFIAYKLKLNNLLIVCQLFIFGIFMNSVPILNSDGYKMMLSIFMYNEKKEKIYNSNIIKFLSFINVLVALAYLIKIALNFFKR